MTQSKLFQPFDLGQGLVLRNRVVMAPMTTWSANDDGTVSDAEVAYYRKRVDGVGLVITGCTHVQANGVGFTGEFAADDDSFIPSLTRLAVAAKSGGAPAILQIFHAGSKTLAALTSDMVSASTVPSDPGPFNEPLAPRAMTEAEIVETIDAFGQATRRAILAGFDGVELHGAHGFLIQQFLSPHSNRRDDRWGGLLANRMGFPLDVVEAVRAAIETLADRPFLLGYRISPEEQNEGGLRMKDSFELIDRLIDAGVDYLHASLWSALDIRPIGQSDGPTVLELLVHFLQDRIPMIAAGSIRTPMQAEQAIHSGLPLVAVGQGLVLNPAWVELAARGRSEAFAQSIAATDVERLAIPAKLWTVIEETPGWFEVRKAA
ncbi:NADH:flavin oxidoreductase [Aureimonas sp. Leaf460]|nr:NADH:flavin oxidoreductase [Aureimonas sp. Leaf427]KQT77274.1 NADH:flavin oxidoreductase [Aureimonas sp. Leaf460]